MGMEGSGLSVADALALQDRGTNDNMFGGNGAWVFFLFFLLAWGWQWILGATEEMQICKGFLQEQTFARI